MDLRSKNVGWGVQRRGGFRLDSTDVSFDSVGSLVKRLKSKNCGLISDSR